MTTLCHGSSRRARRERCSGEITAVLRYWSTGDYDADITGPDPCDKMSVACGAEFRFKPGRGMLQGAQIRQCWKKVIDAQHCGWDHDR